MEPTSEKAQVIRELVKIIHEGIDANTLVGNGLANRVLNIIADYLKPPAKTTCDVCDDPRGC